MNLCAIDISLLIMCFKDVYSIKNSKFISLQNVLWFDSYWCER